MDWREKLRSFPVIAAGVILAAVILGLLLGLATGRPRVLPVTGQVEEVEGGGGVKAGRREAVRGGTSKPDGTGSSTSRPDPPKKPVKNTDLPEYPHKAGTTGPGGGDWSRPKDLKPGKKDTMAARADLPRPMSSMVVVVKTQSDYSVAQAALFLDIQAEGLGWQRVSARAEPTGNTGEWRYGGLYAGTYLVTAAVPGYTDASQQVQLTGAMQEVQVRIELPPPQYGRVIFSFSFDDGGKPQQVFCVRAEKNGRDEGTQGRFGKYGGGPAQLGTMSSGVANYAIPQDNEVLVFSVRDNQREQFNFSATRDTRRYSAQITVTGRINEEQRFDISLKLLDAGAPDPTGGFFSKEAVRAEFTFKRSDGVAFTLRRCNLRVSPDSATYTAATSLVGNVATFASAQPGNYYLVAEADGLGAAYISALTLTANTSVPVLVDVGTLTIRTSRDGASVVPPGTPWKYRAALRPLGSGAIETFYNREIPGNAPTDIATYTVPFGQYTVIMGSTDALLACEPGKAGVNITAEGATLNITLRAAATLEFTCVDAYMNPVAGVEYLLSFSPAGEIPEAEKARVELGGPDGHCKKAGAVYGKVYLHIWVASKDFQAPDKTFEIDLPSYGVLNLGAVTVK